MKPKQFVLFTYILTFQLYSECVTTPLGIPCGDIDTTVEGDRDEAGGEVDEAGTVEGVEGTDGHRSRFECSHCLR